MSSLLIAPQTLNQALLPPLNASPNIINNTAIIPIHGPLVHQASLYALSYGEILLAIETAVNDPDIKSIVLDIDSPGGEVHGLFDLTDTINQLTNIKPIYALINETAYSAAYTIASAATKIIAPRTAQVGSIGVLTSHIDISKANEAAGLNITTLFAGKHKNDFSSYQSLTEHAKKTLQSQITEIYKILTTSIAHYRNLDEQVLIDTDANIFMAKDALDIGLIDDIASANDFYQSLYKENIMTHETTELTSNTEPPKCEAPPTNNPELKLSQERARIKDILQLCHNANMPNLVTGFVDEGIEVADVKSRLFDALAAGSTSDIKNIVAESPQSKENDIINAISLGLKGAQYANV